MKKIINITVRSLLVVCLLVCAFAMASKAKAEVASSDVNVLGAQVRTEGQAGLRFVGSYTGADEVVKYGVAVALGNADAETVKAGAKAEVSEQDEAGQYYVTVYNIPEAAYLQEISALAYVVLADESVVWSDQVVVKNLAGASLAAANAGELAEGNLIETVVNHVVANYKKVYTHSITGYKMIDNAAVVSDPSELEAEFIKDWNAKFGTSFTKFAYSAFQASAQAGYGEGTGLTANGDTDCSGTNAYEFFITDSKTSAKWQWLLTYFLEETNTRVHPKRQINALLNEGSYSDSYGGGLQQFTHLAASMDSFFNGGDARDKNNDINFNSTVYSRYSAVAKHSKVYAASTEGSVKVGESIELSALTPANGYAWVGWNDGSANHNDSFTVVATDSALIPSYSPVSYTITYMDGDQVIEALAGNYNIESDAIELPSYSKDGFVFEGWYDNDACEGEAISTINTGSTGNKVFYAKLTESALASVNVTFNANGGLLNSSNITAEPVKTISVSTYSNTGSANGTYLCDTGVTKANSLRWQYKILLQYISEINAYKVVATDAAKASANNAATSAGVTWTHALSNSSTNISTQLTVGQYIVIDADLVINMAAFNVKAYEASALESCSTKLTLAGALPTPVREGYVFQGWLSSLDSQVYTEFPGYESNPGDITYTAQWVAAAE